jgi:hypothetical protein
MYMNSFMSKLSVLIVVTFMLAAENVFAQKTATTTLTYVSADAILKKTYTKEELELLSKLELTAIYQERVAIITEVLPYLALHSKPGATLAEMSIPQTSANVAHLQKEVKNKEEYITSVNETLVDIIPYADKQNIIWSILFFEDIIKKSNYSNALPAVPSTDTTTK